MTAIDPISSAGAPPRDVIVGAGSAVWRSLAALPGFDRARFVALRHHEVASHAWRPGDRAWIFAYARDADDNRRMFTSLRDAAPGAEFIYVSSSSCIVDTVTGCYGYPRAKRQAERDARALLDARVLVLGLVHGHADGLPRGRNVATSLSMLHDFLLAPRWPSRRDLPQALFTVVERPFTGRFEAALHTCYGALLRACGRWPCLLRPLDAILRACGMRWYGYVYLSNRLWTATS